MLRKTYYITLYKVAIKNVHDFKISINMHHSNLYFREEKSSHGLLSLKLISIYDSLNYVLSPE